MTSFTQQEIEFLQGAGNEVEYTVYIFEMGNCVDFALVKSAVMGRFSLLS